MSRIVMKRHPLEEREGLKSAELVLCYLPDNKVTPFVTWRRNLDDGSTYWGHYFETEAEAHADFEARIRFRD